MKPIFLFLSTGRCGTQWLTANLGRHSDRAAVTHEPLGARYEPRSHFRRYEHSMADHPGAVRAHLDQVEALAQERTYIETGWPLFAAIPAFLERFGARVHLVHLVRHLVPTAASHMVQQCYFGSPRRDAYTEKAALDPSLPGTIQKEEGQQWGQMSPYEKCLFWCTEVHLYARELRRRYPWIRVHQTKAEDLFAGDEDAFQALTGFLGLPHDPGLAASSRRPVDRWHHRNEIDFDWRSIFKHPGSVEVCRELGYDLGIIDQEELDLRYRGTPSGAS